MKSTGTALSDRRIVAHHAETFPVDGGMRVHFWGGECGVILRALPVPGERVELRADNPYRAEHGAAGLYRILTQRPASCELLYDMDSWNLDFFHQNAIGRPDHIKNSYALYHKTKGGLVDSSGPDYKAGKAAHLYRAWAEDGDGWRVWVPQGFNRSRSLLRLTLPEDFRRKARLPITVDPTLGFTSIGASTDSGYNLIFAASPYTMGSPGGTMSKIQLCTWVASPTNVGLAVYTDSGGNPSAFVTSSWSTSLSITRTTKPTIDSEWTSNSGVTGSLSASTAYHLVFEQEGGAAMAYDAGVTIKYATGQTYSAFPPASAPSVPSTLDRKFSFYVTYTDSGGVTGFGRPLAGSRNNPIGLV